MSDNDVIIEEYVSKFEACLAGTSEARAAACAELAGHLAEAEEAGELALVIERLGSPRAAAASFNRESALPGTRFGRRLLAALVDNFPLVAVTIALALQPLLMGLTRTTLAFPPFIYLEFSLGRFSGCVALVPVTCGVYEAGWLYSVALPLALLWSIIGLGLLESRAATTPGKHLLGLRVVDEQGLRIDVKSGIVRRLSLLGGPLAWLDWLPYLKDDQRRLFDHVAGTRVVDVRKEGAS